MGAETQGRENAGLGVLWPSTEDVTGWLFAPSFGGSLNTMQTSAFSLLEGVPQGKGGLNNGRPGTIYCSLRESKDMPY